MEKNNESKRGEAHLPIEFHQSRCCFWFVFSLVYGVCFLCFWWLMLFPRYHTYGSPISPHHGTNWFDYAVIVVAVVVDIISAAAAAATVAVVDCRLSSTSPLLRLLFALFFSLFSSPFFSSLSLLLSSVCVCWRFSSGVCLKTCLWKHDYNWIIRANAIVFDTCSIFFSFVMPFLLLLLLFSLMASRCSAAVTITACATVSEFRKRMGQKHTHTFTQWTSSRMKQCVYVYTASTDTNADFISFHFVSFHFLIFRFPHSGNSKLHSDKNKTSVQIRVLMHC